MNLQVDGTADAPPRGSALEVFRTALALGLTSFGGPVAHLGYFRRTYVERLRWLSAEDYAGVVALCQMLPGPASSQAGFLIGLKRAGLSGALAAFIGFTLPSALLMFAFARLSTALQGPLAAAALHGLRLTAVAVVAQAVWSMGRAHCADRPRILLALAAAILTLTQAGAGVQLLVLAAGAVGGAGLCRNGPAPAAAPRLPIGVRTGPAALGLFIAGWLVLPLAAASGPHTLPALAAAFYRAGALVFGGGHVVLPLLHQTLVPQNWLSESAFLSGYGAVQAAPGPLFSFAGYVGAVAAPGGIGTAALWSAVALAAVFLPGLLLALAGLTLWTWLSRHRLAQAALAGVNAAVVGVLAAAFYDPIWTSAVAGGRDAAIAVTGLALLEVWKTPPILVGLGCVAASLAPLLIG